MSTPPEHFRLPIQKLSRRADRKIRRRLKRAERQERGLLWLAPVLVTALLLSVATAVGRTQVRNYAYASSAVTPGTMLYNLKRQQEKEKLTSLSSATDRAEYYLYLSQRRLDEADTVLTKQPHLALVPKAYAAIDRSSTVSVAASGSIVGGLLVESSQFVSLSIAEANAIKATEARNTVLEQAKQVLKRNARLVSDLEGKVPTSKPAVKQVTSDVKQIYIVNHDRIQQALETPEVLKKPLWIDLDDVDDHFLDYFEEIFGLEEDWDDDHHDDHDDEDDEDFELEWDDSDDDWWEEWHAEHDDDDWREEHDLDDLYKAEDELIEYIEELEEAGEFEEAAELEEELLDIAEDIEDLEDLDDDFWDDEPEFEEEWDEGEDDFPFEDDEDDLEEWDEDDWGEEDNEWEDEEEFIE